MKTNKNIKLDEIKKDNPFRVPDNYFEDFSKKMEEHVAIYAPARKVSFMVKLRPYLYMAASFLVILSVTFAVLNRNEGADDMMAATKNTPVQSNTKPTITDTAHTQTLTAQVTDNDVYIDYEDEEEMMDEILATDEEI